MLGPANSGKSTLINYLMNTRMLATSEKPQTPRVHTRSILTGPDYQIILVDTPGLHEPKNKLGEYMMKEARRQAADADVLLYLVDATRPQLPQPGQLPGNKPLILAVTKADLVDETKTQKLLEMCRQVEGCLRAIPISAVTGHNIETLLAELAPLLPEGPALYPEDQLMDCDLRFLAAEMIREQALKLLEDEVPHGVAVEIERFDEQPEAVTIEATLVVEKDSHKGIAIGRGGQMLKSIGIAARQQLEQLLDSRVHLKLWVKVKKNWRKDANQLRWMGFK